MSIIALFTIILWLAIIAVVATVCFWLVDQAAAPSPFNWALKLIVVLVALYAIVQYVLPAAHLG